MPPKPPHQLPFLAACWACWLVVATGLTGAESRLVGRLTRLPQILTSATGQFTVVGHEPGSPLGPPTLSNVRSNHVQLDPRVLAITCDRVKAELLQLLGAGDQWRCPVAIHVDGPAPPETPVGVSATPLRNGWRFQLRLPGQMGRDDLVRAIVRALLLEMANRDNSGRRLAEAPLWLQEGLAAQLRATHGDALAAGVGVRVFGLTDDPSVPRVVISRGERAYERNYQEVLSAARRHFTLFEPVDFATLQAPGPADLEGFAWATFQHSAHLFVVELLRLPEGGAALLRTIDELKHFLNPQLALLKACANRFPSALAADKWWTLACVDFRSRDVDMRWSQAHTLRRLKEILHVPVEVRSATNAVPEARVMMIQELIRETSFNDHRLILLRAARSLHFVGSNSRPDLARLIGDYRDALEDYVAGTESGDASPARFKVVKDAAVERLDLLDGIRFDFKLVSSSEPEMPEDLERVERMLSRPRLP